MKLFNLSFIATILYISTLQISASPLDMLAFALEDIAQSEIKITTIPKLEHPLIKDIFDQLSTTEFKFFNTNKKSEDAIKKEWEHGYCNKLKTLKQNLIDTINDAQYKVLPLSLEDDAIKSWDVKYKEIYNKETEKLEKTDKRVCFSAIEILNSPEGAIAKINTLIRELACEKQEQLPCGNYELGLELVKQKLATDISKEVKEKYNDIDISKNKFYEIKMEKQKNAECVYCSITSSIYMLFALTKNNAKDAIDILKQHLCLNSSCPFSKLQKASSELFKFSESWLDTECADTLVHTLPYQKKLQKIFSDIQPKMLEKIIETLLNARRAYRGRTKIDKLEFKIISKDNQNTLHFANPIFYTPSSISSAYNIWYSLQTSWIFMTNQNPASILRIFHLLNQKVPYSLGLMTGTDSHAWSVVAHKTSSQNEYFLLDTLPGYAERNNTIESLAFLQALAECTIQQFLEIGIYKANPGYHAVINEKLIDIGPLGINLDYLARYHFDPTTLFENEPKLKKAFLKIM